jgi:hypothetical protein
MSEGELVESQYSRAVKDTGMCGTRKSEEVADPLPGYPQDVIRGAEDAVEGIDGGSR